MPPPPHADLSPFPSHSSPEANLYRSPAFFPHLYTHPPNIYPVYVCVCVCHPSDDINIVVAMKAMGADSDQEVVSLVGQEEALQALMLPSLGWGFQQGPPHTKRAPQPSACAHGCAAPPRRRPRRSACSRSSRRWS